MDSQPNNSLSQPDSDSLEGPVTATTPSPSAVSPETPEKGPRKPGRLRALLRHFNIYVLLFLLVVVITAALSGVLYLQNKKTDTKTIKAQSLSDAALEQISNTETTVGDPKQLLTISSNSVFSGKVLVRDNVDIAGSLQVGGNLSLAGISVAGTSTLETLQVTRDASVTGNASVQGQLNVGRTLAVNGDGTFSGTVSAPQLNVTTLQLGGNLNLTRHIVAGGSTPARSNGPALGGGGTASVSGSDTAGTVTINTGSSPAAGCFATITFSSPYDAVPHVSITPIGSAAAGLSYYATRTTTGFSVCTTTSAPAGQTFGFDYVIFG